MAAFHCGPAVQSNLDSNAPSYVPLKDFAAPSLALASPAALAKKGLLQNLLADLSPCVSSLERANSELDHWIDLLSAEAVQQSCFSDVAPDDMSSDVAPDDISCDGDVDLLPSPASPFDIVSSPESRSSSAIFSEFSFHVPAPARQPSPPTPELPQSLPPKPSKSASLERKGSSELKWCWRCGVGCGQKGGLSALCLVCGQEFAACSRCASERAANGRQPDRCLCMGCLSKPVTEKLQQQDTAKPIAIPQAVTKPISVRGFKGRTPKLITKLQCSSNIWGQESKGGVRRGPWVL